MPARQDLPIIDYAPPDPPADPPFVPAMMRWRSVCGWSFWLGIVSLVADNYFNVPIPLRAWPILASISGMSVGSIMTLIYLAKASCATVGTGYAVRHLILAVALLPVCLLGIFLVPMLVQSDLVKLHRAREPRTK
jgi:hypothetical protein